MTAKGEKTRMLKGAREIGQYLGVSMNTVLKYIQIGMPCEIIHGIYHAYPDNLEEFFRNVTRRRLKDTPPEVE